MKVIFDVIIVAIFIYLMLKLLFIIADIHRGIEETHYKPRRKNDFEGFTEKKGDKLERRLNNNLPVFRNRLPFRKEKNEKK